MKFLGRLNQRFAANIRDGVVRDLGQDQLQRPRPVRKAVRAIAFLVLAIPFAIIALGAVVIWATWFNLVTFVLGVVAIGAGAYLFPRQSRLPGTSRTREELPQLFSLLDALSARMGAEQVDAVHLTDDVNAFLGTTRQDGQVLGFGVPLWLALTAEERLAVLCHEIAHLAHSDPARHGLTAAALQSLERWVDLFTPPALIDHETNTAIVMDDRTITGQIIGGAFGWLFRGLASLYERLLFADSQRAEYMADLAAAQVAGSQAVVSSLRKTIFAPLAEQELSRLHYDGSKHVPVFAQMAEQVRAPDPEAAEALLVHAQEALLTVDQSHPPTRYRMEVAGLQEVAPATDLTIDWAALDAELAACFREREEALLNRYITQ